MKQDNKSIWLAGIYGVVIGDTFGAPFEFKSRDHMQHHPLLKLEDVDNTIWTDDSAMMLATLSSIINTKTIKYTDIMDQFIEWRYSGKYTADGRTIGVGMICNEAIARYRRSKDIFTCGGTHFDENGNGSLMRIMPVCILLSKDKDIKEEDKVAIIHDVSGLTHNHIISKIACVIYYFIVDNIINNNLGKVDIVKDAIEKATKYYKDEEYFNVYDRLKDIDEFKQLPYSEIVGDGYVLHSLEASIWCLLNTDSFEDCLLHAINLGEDADTTAAIVGGLAGLYYGYVAIPSYMVNQVARTEWIREMCFQI